MPTRYDVRFVLDGGVHSVTNIDPNTTLLNYLRDTLHKTGTKEGCAEGDCGACTVVAASLTSDGNVSYQAINACIALLPALDGCELLTVESLASSNNLHPVQQAMVAAHASQCGFCTPGFVMSLFALYKTVADITRQDVNDCLAGNLCRCTGYRPIVDAALDMRSLGMAIPADERSRLNTPAGHGTDDTHIVAMLHALQDEHTLQLQGTDIDGATRSLRAPRHLSEAYAFLEMTPDATILAGGTDVGLWITKQHAELSNVLHLRNVDELRKIEEHAHHWFVGAGVSITRLHETLRDTWSSLDELWRRFASPPIRNAATIGGNVANGSPIGDSMPPLIALGAKVVLGSSDGARTLPLEQFYKGYRQTDLRAGELVLGVNLPKPTASQFFRVYKISKRMDQDISALCGAFAVDIQDDQIAECRIAFGGMAAIPARAHGCEQVLSGQVLDVVHEQPDVLESAKTVLAADYTPISDLRASGRYRQLVAGNLLEKFLLELAECT